MLNLSFKNVFILYQKKNVIKLMQIIFYLFVVISLKLFHLMSNQRKHTSEFKLLNSSTSVPWCINLKLFWKPNNPSEFIIMKKHNSRFIRKELINVEMNGWKRLDYRMPRYVDKLNWNRPVSVFRKWRRASEAEKCNAKWSQNTYIWNNGVYFFLRCRGLTNIKFPHIQTHTYCYIFFKWLFSKSRFFSNAAHSNASIL